MHLEFDQSLVTGNDMIDAQHKELIGKIDDLLRKNMQSSKNRLRNFMICWRRKKDLQKISCLQ